MTGVMELRQYTLQPGSRDALAELFERYFLDGLEAAGMQVPGIFEDLDDPDRLVWWRGFSDMASRHQSLAEFYLHGPVWREHREAANATMIDSDDVLLLAPVHIGPGYPDASAPRMPAPDHGARGGSLIVDVVPLSRLEQDGVVADRVAELVVAAAEAEGAEVILVALTHPEPNDFTGLPVRDEQVATWWLRYPDSGSRARVCSRLGIRTDDEQVRLRPLNGSRIG